MSNWSVLQFSKCYVAAFLLVVIPLANCGDFGTIKCNNGSWAPDGKLIGFGLSCPLPLDGKDKTKGKTLQCAMKKADLYNDKTKEVKKDKIAPELCGIFSQDDLAKQCKQKVTECLKGKEYFKDTKTDKEYATWSPLYKCVEKWAGSACKK